MSDTLFDLGPASPLSPADDRLVAAYVAAGRGLDDLPYTDEFAALMASLRAAKDTRDEREVLHRLHNLRKAKKLPQLGKTPTPAIKVSADEETFLCDRVRSLVGSLGARDNLPYTAKMDDLVRDFNAFSGRNLTPHDIWRLVAKVAK
ncbi:MAG TPA: hypothetical protein VK157_13685 [Phycisphaerales bacterium]|nr:hypothetical protein [Phycisphaerales bacterium]